MKPSGFREWMLVAVLMGSISIPLYAQPMQLTQAERERFDSLLYVVDFDQLRVALERKDAQVQSLNVNESTWAIYRQQVQGYIRVLETLSSIKEQEPDYIADYVTKRLGQEEQYQSAEVGYQAANLYEAFTQLGQGGAYSDAAGYYVAARFFKGRHLQMIEERLASHYDRALLAYEAEAYEAAQRTIDSVRTYFGSINALHLPWIDRLERLYANAERLQAEEEKEERNWGRSERPSFKVGLSLEGQVITRGTVGPLALNLTQDERTVFTIEEEFKGSFAQGIGLVANASLGPQWGIGGGFMYTNYKYSGTSNTGFFLTLI